MKDERSPAERNLGLANWQRRAINFIVDAFLIIVVWFVILFLLETFWKDLSRYDPRYEAPPIFPPYNKNICGVLCTIATAVLGFTYYLLLEFSWGITLGKMLTNTRVLSATGGPPDFLQILTRTVLRVVPWDFATFLPRCESKWHDRFSGTVVVHPRRAQSR